MGKLTVKEFLFQGFQKLLLRNTVNGINIFNRGFPDTYVFFCYFFFSSASGLRM